MSLDGALLLLDADRPEDALRALQDEFDPEDAWCWFASAAAYLQLERYDDAIAAATNGLSVEAENPFLLDVLASAQLLVGQLVAAERTILAALQLDAEDPMLLTRYAHIVARAGQMEKAEKLVARALALEPEHPYALQMHAIIAGASANRRETIARSLALLRHDPENPLAHRLLGATHVESGRVLDAERALSTAVRLDPTRHDVADAARATRLYRHPLMLPVRLTLRVGAVPMWLGAVITMLVLRAAGAHRALGVFAIAWVAFCAYTWLAPPTVRWLLRRRGV